jgi:hypothetical protein
VRCRICGSETAEYRMRSGMALCDACHVGTPSKVTFAEFVATIRASENLTDVRTLREFYSDYKTSTIGDVREYWASCSELA